MRSIRVIISGKRGAGKTTLRRILCSALVNAGFRIAAHDGAATEYEHIPLPSLGEIMLVRVEEKEE